MEIISKKVFKSSPLLQALLCSSQVPDVELELFFTALRRNILKASISIKVDIEISPIYCALARQCFINEYVYYQTSEEINDLKTLQKLIENAIQNGQQVPAILIVVFACYFPLYLISGSNKLLQQNWSDDVKSVLNQQIQEPTDELDLRLSISRLTNIENHVSLAVQAQYEEHPYPRWVRLPKQPRKNLLNSIIRSKFPLVTFCPLVNGDHPEILIAGCGSGQHPIGVAQSIIGAKILAVDLSIASLSYAKRKTIELDIETIEYAQADILGLASTGRNFDVIESSGVLHHLENPFQGWKVLLSLLRPNGLMKLGFYSEIARQEIVYVQNLIRRDCTGSSSSEIRNFRKKLLELDDPKDFESVIRTSDFYSISMCRDLLFHVQEHRMSLDTISQFIEENNLNFLGFEIDLFVIQKYKNRFPDDPSATNLNNWSTYEKENPKTFIGMYQFFVQKNQGLATGSNH